MCHPLLVIFLFCCVFSHPVACHTCLFRSDLIGSCQHLQFYSHCFSLSPSQLFLNPIQASSKFQPPNPTFVVYAIMVSGWWTTTHFRAPSRIKILAFPLIIFSFPLYRAPLGAFLSRLQVYRITWRIWQFLTASFLSCSFKVETIPSVWMLSISNYWIVLRVTLVAVMLPAYLGSHS